MKKYLLLTVLFISATAQPNVPQTDVLEITQTVNETITTPQFCDQFGTVMVEVFKLAAIKPKSKYTQDEGRLFIGNWFDNYSKEAELTIPPKFIYYATEVISIIPILPEFKKNVRYPISKHKQSQIQTMGFDECMRMFK